MVDMVTLHGGDTFHLVEISNGLQDVGPSPKTDTQLNPNLVDSFTWNQNLDLDSYQIHARCILLDTKTGYRSQYLAISGIIQL